MKLQKKACKKNENILKKKKTRDNIYLTLINANQKREREEFYLFIINPVHQYPIDL